jgi:hypothetical protein
MKDTTPKQTAAAKQMVNNGSAPWTWSHMGHPSDACRSLIEFNWWQLS